MNEVVFRLYEMEAIDYARGAGRADIMGEAIPELEGLEADLEKKQEELVDAIRDLDRFKDSVRDILDTWVFRGEPQGQDGADLAQALYNLLNPQTIED